MDEGRFRGISRIHGHRDHTAKPVMLHNTASLAGVRTDGQIEVRIVGGQQALGQHATGARAAGGDVLKTLANGATDPAVMLQHDPGFPLSVTDEGLPDCRRDTGRASDPGLAWITGHTGDDAGDVGDWIAPGLPVGNLQDRVGVRCARRHAGLNRGGCAERTTGGRASA